MGVSVYMYACMYVLAFGVRVAIQGHHHLV